MLRSSELSIIKEIGREIADEEECRMKERVDEEGLAMMNGED